MEFNLPLRPAPRRGLARPGTKADLRAGGHGDTAPTNINSNDHLTNNISDFLAQPRDKTLRPAKSRSQLAPVNTDRINKPSLKKKATKVNLRGLAAAETATSKQEAKTEKEDDDLATAESWKALDEYIKDETATSEMGQSMKELHLPKQSRRLKRVIAANEDDEKVKEEILKTMTAKDVPVNVHVTVSFRAIHSGSPMAFDVRILVNEVSNFAEFTKQLQIQHGVSTGGVLLRSREPTLWKWQSRRGMIEATELTSRGGVEYSESCESKDAGATYEEFWAALQKKGKHEAGQAVQRAQERQRHAKMMRKSAKFTLEGRPREFPEVHLPSAFDLYAFVDVFFEDPGSAITK